MSRPAAAASRSVRSGGAAAAAPSGPLAGFRFEIVGKVQGVFFKHTKATADRLQLVGWVANTSTGTVVGEAQGPATALAQMKTWLSTTGSPKSVIEEAKFEGEGPIAAPQFTSFTIRK